MRASDEGFDGVELRSSDTGMFVVVTIEGEYSRDSILSIVVCKLREGQKSVPDVLAEIFKYSSSV